MAVIRILILNTQNHVIATSAHMVIVVMKTIQTNQQLNLLKDHQSELALLRGLDVIRKIDMKFLIAAAALLAATPAVAQLPADTDPITANEVVGRAMICMKLHLGELEPTKVVSALQLDTARKIRDFSLQCSMFELGAKTGAQAARESLPQAGVSKNGK